MAQIDLSSYNLGELKGLQLDVEREIKDRQQQEMKKAREQILSIAQDLGVSVEDLLNNTNKKSKGENKVQAQYRNPEDQGQTWSGRGRQPKWVVEGLATGKTMDDFRIQ